MVLACMPREPHQTEFPLDGDVGEGTAVNEAMVVDDDDGAGSLLEGEGA